MSEPTTTSGPGGVGHPILADMTNSGGDPRDLTPVQQSELTSFFNGSLFHFAYTFFGFHDLVGSGYRPLHWEICQLLGEWGEEPTEDWHPGRRLMIQVPRGSFKTSLCTLANALWQVCRNPDETLLICNEVVDNSKKWLRAIREITMTNRLFQTVYKDLLPPGIHWLDKDQGKSIPRWWKWNDQEVVFNRGKSGIPEASLTAAGVGSATTGGHWDRIIKDDLISEDAKNSPSLMERARQWFDSSLPLERPSYKGIDLVVCTPWTYTDVYRYILETYHYKLYRRSVLEEHPITGEEYSILPNRWTVDELHQERERNPFYFNAQMMCSPQAGKEQSFQPSWLRYFTVTEQGDDDLLITIEPTSYTETASKLLRYQDIPNDDDGTGLPPPETVTPPPTVLLSHCNLALVVDPASVEKDSKAASGTSSTGMVPVAEDPWGRRYLLDCWKGRGNPDEVMGHIFRFMDRWPIRRVGIEETIFAIVYRYWLRDEARRRGKGITLIPVKPKGRRKDDRIRQLIPGFRRGFYYLNRSSKSLESLKREYLDFPYSTSRDLLDALAYTSEVLHRPADPAFMTEDRLDEEGGRLSKLDVTGYGQPYF